MVYKEQTKTYLSGIRSLFNKIMFGDNQTTVTTNDGKNLIVIGNDVQEGFEIYLLDENNKQTPLESGDYTLDDGRIITVTMDGTKSTITGIKLPDAPQADKQAETPVMMEDGMPDGQLNSDGKTEEDVKQDGDVESRISGLEQTVSQLLEMIKPLLENTEKMMSKNFSLQKEVEDLGGQPDGKKLPSAKKFASDFTKTITDDEKEYSLDGAKEALKKIQSNKEAKFSGKEVEPTSRLERIAKLAKKMQK